MKLATILTFVTAIALAATYSPPASEERDCSHIHFTPFSVKIPVCGSDGTTYMNLLHLKYTNCRNSQNITVVKEGYCDEEEARRAEEAHRQTMANYAKLIRKAIKEGRPIPYIADLPLPNLDDYPEEEEEKEDDEEVDEEEEEEREEEEEEEETEE